MQLSRVAALSLLAVFCSACVAPKQFSKPLNTVRLPQTLDGEHEPVKPPLDPRLAQALSNSFSEYAEGRGRWLSCKCLPPATLQLVKTAFTSNPQLASNLIELDSARARAHQAKWLRYPQLAIAGSSRRERVGQAANTPTDTSTKSSLGLDLSWSPDFFGVEGIAQKVEGLNLQQALLSHEIERERIALDAVNQAIALAESLEQVELAKSLYQSLLASERTIRGLVVKGLAAKIDYDRAHSEAAKAESEYLDRLQKLDEVQRQTSLVLGVYVSNFDVAFEAENVAFISPPELSEPVIDVLLNQPRALRSQIEVRRNDFESLKAFRQRFPRLSFSAFLGRERNNSSLSLAVSANVQNMLIEATLPLFQRGRLRLDQDLREDKAHQSALALRSVLLESFHELALAWQRNQTIKGQIQAQQEALLAAQKAEGASMAAYRRGVLDYLALLNAQRTVYTLRQSLITLRKKQLETWVAIQALTAPASHAI